jgi:hypothetical protein
VFVVVNVGLALMLMFSILVAGVGMRESSMVVRVGVTGC